MLIHPNAVSDDKHGPLDASIRLPLSRAEMAVLGFTIVYMAVSLIASFFFKNIEFIFYFAVMLALIGAVAALHWRVRLHIVALWGLSVWGLAHMAGGLMPIPASWPASGATRVLYNWWLVPGLLKYDQAVHAYGFGLVTWICWLSLRAAFTKRGISVQPTLGLLTLCIAGGMGFGAANEVVEFIATLTLAGTNVGGYANTGWDLISNCVGCVLAAILIYIRAVRDEFILLREPP